MALVISKGKGRRGHVDVKQLYIEMSNDGASVSFLSPGSYTDKELLAYAKEGKLYYPLAKAFGIV